MIYCKFHLVRISDHDPIEITPFMPVSSLMDLPYILNRILAEAKKVAGENKL